MPTATSEKTEIENPLHRLTDEEIDAIGDEFQKIHDEVFDDLGDRDAHYIRSVIEFHRRLAALSRIVLMASQYKPAWLLGTVGLSTAKIIENMEIGHNVMHGQWDWMNDPYIHSSTWDWDTASPPPAGWRCSRATRSRRGRSVPPSSGSPRSWRTWRSATTSCTASGIG